MVISDEFWMRIMWILHDENSCVLQSIFLMLISPGMNEFPDYLTLNSQGDHQK